MFFRSVLLNIFPPIWLVLCVCDSRCVEIYQWAATKAQSLIGELSAAVPFSCSRKDAESCTKFEWVSIG